MLLDNKPFLFVNKVFDFSFLSLCRIRLCQVICSFTSAICFFNSAISSLNSVFR
jgi:hypothetical protein